MVNVIDWQPIKTLPDFGTFLVYLEEEDEVHPGRIGIGTFHPKVQIINGGFHYDKPRPTHWAKVEPPK